MRGAWPNCSVSPAAAGPAGHLRRIGRSGRFRHAGRRLGDRTAVSRGAGRVGAPAGLPDAPAAALSGGERTRVLLAGWSLHEPGIVLLDEPTNHLDRTARLRLYDRIDRTHATLVVVSHDLTLLERLHTTCELTPAGIRIYGGNYDLYRMQKGVEQEALAERIGAERTALRRACERAQVVRERQERRSRRAKGASRRRDWPVSSSMPADRRRRTARRGCGTGTPPSSTTRGSASRSCAAAGRGTGS